MFFCKANLFYENNFKQMPGSPGNHQIGSPKVELYALPLKGENKIAPE